jgi:hypothetical protein
MALAVDLAIDGSVLVLNGDGSLDRFVDGEATSFTLEDVPGGLGMSTGLYTSATAGRILIADREGGRVVEVSPDGRFERQLLPPLGGPTGSDSGGIDNGKFGELHGIWLDEAREQLYVVDGSALYSTPYP